MLTDRRDAPAWMAKVAGVNTLSGYRVGYTPRMLLRSLFTIHNETANVWTHLLGFLVVLGCAAHVVGVVLRDGSWADHGLFATFLLSALWCMGASSVYHLTYCHSQGVHRTTLFCDFFGISLLVTGSFIPCVYYAFACFPLWRAVYTGLTAAVGAATLVLPWFAFFQTWYWRRIGLYFAAVASGVVPAVHIMLLMPLNETTWPMFMGVFKMMLCYAAGLVFYAAKIPERWFPGQFDYWLHSHQIWHVFVLAATVAHCFTCIGVYQRAQPPQC